MKKLVVPAEVAEYIENPDFLFKLENQRLHCSCGTCSLRAVLGLQFDYDVREKSLWEYKRRVFDKGMINGIQPREIASIFKSVGRRSKRDIKVFSSRNGDIKQLEYITHLRATPIIHRELHEDDLDSHYEVVIGINKKEVYLFNPANNLETSGFYKKSFSEFMDSWWPHSKFSGERWYLAAIEKDEKLPKNFKGRYL